MHSRIGIGYDIHKLVHDRPLYIGGISIPYVKGLLGYSDADVLLHAICDALLGALGEKDIGELFPNTDSRYENISSVQLLAEVNSLVAKHGFTINNIDAVIIAEEPPISPFKEAMKNKIAEILSLDTGAVNIKAKTNEGLDDIGKKDAIACYAVAMLGKGGAK